jgi:hypothetical protein
MLERAINKYKNRGIDTVQVIEELLEFAKKNSEAGLLRLKILFFSCIILF